MATSASAARGASADATLRPPATSASAGRSAGAAFTVGAAFAIAAAAGTALLLYTGQGFLRAAGVLVGMAVGALAAGLWAGSSPVPRLRWRWLGACLAYLAAVVAVTAWTSRPALRAWPPGDALAMLLLLALPAYAVGLLLAGLGARGRSQGQAAMAGAALGVVLAAGLLIPRLDAPLVFALATVLVAGAAATDWRRAAHGTGAGGGGMEGPVVIISGVARRGQLAFTIAGRLVRDGWRLVLTARSEEVRALAAELGASPDRVLAVSADLLDPDAVQRVVDVARERFGRIDALVNTAGGLAHTGSVEDTDAEALRAEFDRNVTTALNLTRAALPALRDAHGAIVNFASPAALRAPATMSAYSAAKAGVIALTRALAAEEKQHGVRINAIAPGMMDTEQNRASAGEQTRFVPREDVAEVVRFLISPAARGVTGETIQVLGETIR